MAKPTSLPTKALDAVPESILEHLQGLPPQTTPPDHVLPDASAAIPEEALPLPEHAGVPDWLLPA